MRELWSRFIINGKIELKMFWYANVFYERRELGGDNSERSERQWMLRKISDEVIRSEHSDWWEESVSAGRYHFEWSKYVLYLFFQVGMFYSVVLYLYKLIYIFCYVVVRFSLYRLFARWILYYIYRPLKWGGVRILINRRWCYNY